MLLLTQWHNASLATKNKSTLCQLPSLSMTNVLVSSFADKPVALSTEPVVTGDEPVLSQTVATSPTPQTLDRHSRL